MIRTITLISTAFFAMAVSGQNTLGTISYDPASALEGYNLYFPHGQETVWLLDNCGQIVHSWPDTLMRPGNSVYLTDDGDLWRCAKEPGIVNSVINGGGAGQYIQRKDWNNNVLWQFEYNDSTIRAHHDIAPMPNGNVLIVAWQYKSVAEAIQAGRDPALLPSGSLWPDQIVEVEPVGADSGNIVWEWNAWDHLVQDFDPNMDNFGVVADHPELIDVNFAEASAGGDWLHVNAVDYNETLDQILISVPFFNEIWIVDHSTTMAEAASHSGGNSGMGGDLIYRWGNPRVYDTGDTTDMTLSFQHDAHWMDIGLDPGDPDFGKILLFNNRIGGDYSRVDILEPPVNGSNYTLAPGAAYGPAAASWSYTTPSPTDLFSSGLAGVQKLDNGNFLICSGRQGWTFEIDPANNNDIVWQFINPFLNGAPGTQGAVPGPNQNIHFRMNRYFVDHPAFIGQNLSPQGYIELEPDTAFCDSVLSVGIAEAFIGAIKVFPNPATDQLLIEAVVATEYEVLDMQGRSVLSGVLRNGPNRIGVAGIPAGSYVLRIGNGSFAHFIKMTD